jgi:cytochrome P450
VDWATGLDSRVKKTAAELDGMVERTLAEHEASRGNEDSREAGDLLDSLLSIYKDGDQGQGFTLDRIDVKALILVTRSRTSRSP